MGFTVLTYNATKQPSYPHLYDNTKANFRGNSTSTASVQEN